MEYLDYLDDLKERFPNRDFLFVDDVAEVLSRSPKAIRSLIERGKFPQAKKRGGRVGVTLSEMAEFLCDGDTPAKPSKTASKPSTSFLRAPSGRRPSLAAMIAAARLQADFANALAISLEVIALGGKADSLPPRPPL